VTDAWVKWKGGELSGRVAFGVGAVLMFAFLVALGVVGVQRLRRSAKAVSPSSREQQQPSD
jgi:hypothetical protein